MTVQQTFDFLDTWADSGKGGLRKESPRPPEESPKVASSPEAETPGETVAPSKMGSTKEDVLRQLRAQVGCISTALGGEVIETISTGSSAIDRLLPRGGLRVGAITEWVAEADGCGAASLAMIAAATQMNSAEAASGAGGLLVVVGSFYPPAAVALGISAARIIWVRPTRHADLVWAIDQALRCESVAAVWAQVGAGLDDRDARRFQLAAEVGRTPGLLIRPAATRGRPTFADVRLHVGNQRHATEVIANDERAASGEPRPQRRAMKVTLDRCRGGTIGHSVWVQIDDRARIHSFTPQPLGICKDETAAVHLASELAHPKTSYRQTGRANLGTRPAGDRRRA